MSSVQLLDKTRKIGKLLHNNNSSKVVFNDICNVLKEILQSNVLVISKKGKILGVGRTDGIETLDELNKIRADGKAKRANAEQELGRIEGELRQKMLEING